MARSSWSWILYHVSTEIIFWEKKAIECHWPIVDLEKFGSSGVIWQKECWSEWFEVIWLKIPPMAYSETSVSIRIWHSGSKFQGIGALVKPFRRCIKTFLASGVRKSVSEELTFAKLTSGKSDFLDLVNSAIVDRFSIFLLPLALPEALGVS